ncbi:MAG: LeuA family protein [Nostoc sp. DedSLP03]|uniref:LeuA family protein n=1 Tax=Nostoc sp. DedSLP03 TaxID=3075400 RepID=UPI002AD2EBD6|nr:LeuA family protein [Nostoc sp. DedSLP03]MDZ7965818.1 LeuA family protein [Nostoc sp. DedSLP03]
MKASNLIHDWNEEPKFNPKTIQLCDETLRDGLQGGVPRLPSEEEKLDLLAMADSLGIYTAAVGFPAQEIAYQEALALCQGAQKRGLNIRLALLGRMVEADIQAIARIQQASGRSVAAWLFLACSPMRRYLDAHDLDELERLTRYGIGLAAKLGLPVSFGTEDTTRTEPEVLERLFRAAIEEGAETVALCDTVGHLTPIGTERLVKHFRRFLDEHGFDVKLEFHGHNDRGLGVSNNLAAVSAGVDRVHCTALGIGERSGNIPLELTLVNLKIQGLWSGDISGLNAYCTEVSKVCQLTLPTNYPVFGANAFLTQAGVHASAILKAEILGEPEIAALVYSGVDPRLVGLDYSIQVGPYSGHSNVRFLLFRKGLKVEDQVVNKILAKARTENRVLADEEVYALAQS